MKKLMITSLVALVGLASQGALTRLVPEHGVSKAFTLKTDSNVEYVVRFYRPDVFRVEATVKQWEGEGENRTYKLDFTDKRCDPNRVQILVPEYKEDTTGVKFADQDGKFTFKTTEMTVEFDKASEKMTLLKNGKVLLAETQPLIFVDGMCVQTLASTKDERFYGGGQQVGRFTHKGQKILIDCDYNWAEGGSSNPAPFVMSSNGYGIMRHTFAAGEYDFTAENSCALMHRENRFDAFYFVGKEGCPFAQKPVFAHILDLYTEATGRPNFLPMWGLELGDADAYMTRDKETKYPQQTENGEFVEVTPVVIDRVAKKYREADMPGGWILVNDGYGCGYTMLGSVAYDLAQYGFYTGLWTEGKLDRIAWEVGTVGTRVQKLDVAWTSQGGHYKAQHALQCNADAYLGITTNSNARAFIWTVLGWAGTQRYGICWAGDQYCGWDLIRYMIPTITGSSMSAQSYATTDIDGIFGGSNETYLRDLQWKCWTTAIYVMNGWSHINKGPWSYPEPYQGHIRKALKEKIRLTPYMYALMREALEDATPIIRPMVWNYPNDPQTWDDSTKYQFMVGDEILVAPIYTSMKLNKGWWRKGIYLPNGGWYDYNDGRRLAVCKEGAQGDWMKAYPIDLGKIPVFVKSGSIIPLYDEALTTTDLDKTRMTFDVWPGCCPKGASFVTYEDDGSTRAYEQGDYARYQVRAGGPCTQTEIGDMCVSVKPLNCGKGTYEGAPLTRVFEFAIHLQSVNKPFALVMDGREIAELTADEGACVKTLFKNVRQGWYYDPNEKFGTLHVKLAPRSFGAKDQPFNFVVKMTEHGGALVARVTTPDYPVPSAEEDEAAAAALTCKAVNMPQVNNTNSGKFAEGENMVVNVGNRIIIDRLDGTYRRLTGHVATHPDNKPEARFTFTIKAGNKVLFERANMKGSDVPQLIAIDVPGDKDWLVFDFKADDDSEASKSAKGVWKNVEFVAE